MYELENNTNKWISIWLGLVCFAIVLMIFIGGLTRLTDSGLSMTDWKPITGIIPPLDEASWNLEFSKYKNYPEYKLHNIGMNIDEFKSIYLLEFIHRIAGRITVLLYVLPLLLFVVCGKIKLSEMKIYLFALLLFASQGLMGWYMVKSGLSKNPYVSQYRLAMHLVLAILLYAILFWQMMRMSFSIILVTIGSNLSKLIFIARFSILLLFMQIIFGAFVAGLNAGLIYNNFPYMGNSFLPLELFKLPINITIFDNPVFVQFMHRNIAYLLFIVVSIFTIYVIRFDNKKLTRVAFFVIGSLLLQFVLGVITLLFKVPIIFALLHQFGAILLLTSLLWLYFLLKMASDIA